MENQIEEKLEDYLIFFKKNLKSNDKKEIAKKAILSVSTVYNYLNGAILDPRKAKDIMLLGKEILSKRNIIKI